MVGPTLAISCEGRTTLPWLTMTVPMMALPPASNRPSSAASRCWAARPFDSVARVELNGMSADPDRKTSSRVGEGETANRLATPARGEGHTGTAVVCKDETTVFANGNGPAVRRADGR